MTLDQKFRTPKAFLERSVLGHTRHATRLIMAVAAALALAVLGLVISLNVHAAPAPTSFPLWGTLDTQTSTAATEDQSGVRWPCSS